MIALLVLYDACSATAAYSIHRRPNHIHICSVAHLETLDSKEGFPQLDRTHNQS
jgi:hypothetical protein